MAEDFSKMTPEEIEAWNARNGLKEGDEDYRYPNWGMTAEELHAEAWPELETDDNRNGFTELSVEEFGTMATMMQGLISTKH